MKRAETDDGPSLSEQSTKDVLRQAVFGRGRAKREAEEELAARDVMPDKKGHYSLDALDKKESP